MAGNAADAAALIREAHGRGAKFISTPEMTNILEPDRPRLKGLARREDDDQSVRGFSQLAQELGIWLNIGSLALNGDGEKLVNRSLLFAPNGRIAARYDKIHLFDVDLPDGQRLRESETYESGSKLAMAETPFGKLGLSICYDVRFPTLFHALAVNGCGLVTVPSAFTVPTGEAHWHVLLRARAIETGSFVLAAAQGGVHAGGRATYGHSLAVTPWGEIIAEGGTEPQALVFEIDTSLIASARSRIPALNHARRFDLKAGAVIAT
jgi:deaminated glutathione amidase